MSEQASILQTSSNAGLDARALDALDSSIQGYIDTGRTFGASILVARGGVIGHRKLFGTVAPTGLRRTTIFI